VGISEIKCQVVVRKILNNPEKHTSDFQCKRNKPTKTWPTASWREGAENVVNFLLFWRKQK